MSKLWIDNTQSKFNFSRRVVLNALNKFTRETTIILAMPLQPEAYLRNPSLSTLLALVLVAGWMCVQVGAAVSWASYPDIASGQIVAYSGPQLVNSNSAAVTFTQPISLSSASTPISIAVGINLFQVPNDQDFSIITNKTFTTTSLTLRVYLQDDTVCQELRFNYIAMVTSSQTFRLLSDFINPTVISDSFGYRSETDIINVNTTADPFFTSTSLSSVLVLEGFRVDPFGSFSFVDSIVTIGTNGTINATFFTFEQITITYIGYSILFFDPQQAATTTQLLFQLGSVQLTSNSSAASTFFSGILPRYTAAAGRMFFGLSSFNFSLSATKRYGFDSSNIANLYSTYTFSNSIYSIKLSYFFFVQRSCTTALYFYYNYSSPALDDCVATCSGYTDRPTNDNIYWQCLPCDASCLTCSGVAASACQSCNASNYRVMAGTAPSACGCMSGYVDVGSSVCVPCSSQITGCQTCTNAGSCMSCLSGFTGPPCSCPSGSIVTGYCNTVIGCTNISAINGSQTCINCNATLLMQLTSSFVCACIRGTITLPDLSCVSNCGDNYVLTVEGCDDGNSIDGDGCSSMCTVDQNWVCVGRLAQGSTCKINTTIQLAYMGTSRDTSSNTAILYYSLSPTFSKFSQISDYNSLFSNTVNSSAMNVVYSTSQNLLIATIQYGSSIQNTEQQFQLLLNNSKYFWYPTNYVKPTLTGINCELTYDQSFVLRQAVYYMLLIVLFSSILVFIVSCLFFQKWIGLQLILTFQTYYFQFALIKEFPFQLSPFPEVLKWSQGFDGILGSEYYRTYGLPNYLLTLNLEKEFISNFNTMYLLIITFALVLVVMGLRKRRYKLILEQIISSEISKKLRKSQKWFSFVFSRIFMMSVFFSMPKIIFSFCIQLSNFQSALEYFPDQLNVSAGILAFIILFSMISYVLYWYLLLPDNFTEEQEFMSIRFQNMKFNYPILYLGYQAVFMLILSILLAQTYVLYILLPLQVIYLIALIIHRPYNTVYRLNSFVHNFTIVFNQVAVITCLGIIMRWNHIAGTDQQPNSNDQITAYGFIMLFMLMISLGLAIFRLAIFNKEFSFSCCKKKQEEFNFQEIDYESMKRMETQRKAQFLSGQPKNLEMAMFSHLKAQNMVQQVEKKKKNLNIQKFENFDQTQLDSYLKQLTVWNKQTLLPNNAPKISYYNIKRSSNSRQAELKKSEIGIYLQSMMKNEEGKL